MHAALYLLSVLALALCYRAAVLTCTVFSGGGGQYLSVSDAMANCGGGLTTDLDLVLDGLFVEQLVFPLAQTSVTLRSLSVSPKAVLAGGAFLVDQFSFTSITIQDIILDGLGSGLPLFQVPLRNTNITMENVEVINFYGRTWMMLESCDYRTRVIVRDSLFQDFPSNVFFLLGVETSVFERNTFARVGGGNDTATFASAVFIQMIDDAPYGSSIWTQNIGWRKQSPNLLAYCNSDVQSSGSAATAASVATGSGVTGYTATGTSSGAVVCVLWPLLMGAVCALL